MQSTATGDFFLGRHKTMQKKPPYEGQPNYLVWEMLKIEFELQIRMLYSLRFDNISAFWGSQL